MSARIPDDLRAKIAADYAEGLTAPQVARKYGIGSASVYRIAESGQVGRSRKFPNALLDDAVQDYLDSGDSIRTVAERHPLSADTLRHELRRRGDTRPNGSTISGNVRRAALEDFLTGMSIARVCQKHGVGRSTISSWLDQEGLGAEDREGESPSVYDGGWELVGGVRRPLKPARKRVA